MITALVMGVELAVNRKEELKKMMHSDLSSLQLPRAISDNFYNCVVYIAVGILEYDPQHAVNCSVIIHKEFMQLFAFALILH